MVEKGKKYLFFIQFYLYLKTIIYIFNSIESYGHYRVRLSVIFILLAIGLSKNNDINLRYLVGICLVLSTLGNFFMLPNTWYYLMTVIDIAATVLLFFNKDIKAYCESHRNKRRKDIETYYKNKFKKKDKDKMN
ncbi:hypothetical protein FACS1894132_04050 [Clostridia bacterium]|nr:hypothetical protein FACS1894132_04050 [Clostridia bacterium]